MAARSGPTMKDLEARLLEMIRMWANMRHLIDAEKMKLIKESQDTDEGWDDAYDSAEDLEEYDQSYYEEEE